MKNHQFNIKRVQTKMMHETLDTKIYLLLNDQLSEQVSIPQAGITAQLETIY